MCYSTAQKILFDMITEEPKLSADRHEGVEMETKRGTGDAVQEREQGVGPAGSVSRACILILEL